MKRMLPKFIDIAVNATDHQYLGHYNGSQKHPNDLLQVLQRAKKAGTKQILITGTTLEESKEAVCVAEKYGSYCTVGVHPTRSGEILDDIDGGLKKLSEIIEAGRCKGRVLAVGECGLDYDRLHHASKETQIPVFRAQLGLAKKHSLPLFLHSRAAHEDFIAIMRERKEDWADHGGVVHSFTGTTEEVDELLELSPKIFIGVNGCSLKTTENQEMIKSIPLSRILLETDAPYCSITTTSASHALLSTISNKDFYLPTTQKKEKWSIDGNGVKGRNEPCAVGAVAHCIASLKNVTLDEVAEVCWKNTVELFGEAIEKEMLLS